MKNKKGVSPVIATLLLVVIVIILAMLIFIWAKSFIKEAITKRDKPASQICNEVKLQAYYESSSNKVIISNIGNYPVYRVELKLKKSGDISISKIDKQFPLGASEEIPLGDTYDEVEVVPVILGENSKRKQTQYTCQENTILAEPL